MSKLIELEITYPKIDTSYNFISIYDFFPGQLLGPTHSTASSFAN